MSQSGLTHEPEPPLVLSGLALVLGGGSPRDEATTKGRGRGFLLKKKHWLRGRWARVGNGDRRDGGRAEVTMFSLSEDLLFYALF